MSTFCEASNARSRALMEVVHSAVAPRGGHHNRFGPAETHINVAHTHTVLHIEQMRIRIHVDRKIVPQRPSPSSSCGGLVSTVSTYKRCTHTHTRLAASTLWFRQGFVYTVFGLLVHRPHRIFLSRCLPLSLGIRAAVVVFGRAHTRACKFRFCKPCHIIHVILYI